jgi:hypothetical protein
MRVVRTVAWPTSLLFCVSLLVAGCGGDDSAETSSSKNSAADTPEVPATPGEPAASDPATPEADAVAGSEAGFEQSEPDTIVGPVARLEAGGEREVTAASSRQVLKRGLGSTVATSDDTGVPEGKTVKTTAAAQPPVNVKVGLEVGNQAPEISGEDIDGKKFKLSDYRGKVVMLDFWGDW